MFKCGVLKHTLEGLLACLNVEFLHWNVFLLVLMWSSQAYIGRVSCWFKCGVLKHTGRSSLFKCGVLKQFSTLEGLLACLNGEF